MVTQVLDRVQILDDVRQCVPEGERLGLYSAFETAGPITAFGLANEAMVPVSLAMRWLASQMHAGYLVRDVATGRYRTWCELSPDGPPSTSSAGGGRCR